MPQFFARNPASPRPVGAQWPSAAPRGFRARVVVEHARGELAGVGDELAVFRHPQQSQATSARPTGRSRARRLRGAARDRSRRARIRRECDATASTRSRASVRLPAVVTSRQSPGTPPRPTRPRSWCSCDTPKRSASRTTIVDAFGTSTPTSMTVVATSTSISPAANARMMASFSSLGIRRAAARIRRPASAGLAVSCASTVGDVCAAVWTASRALALGVVLDPLASIAGHTTKAWRPCASSSATRSQTRGNHPGFSASGTT